jgi:hypothetical protein
MDADGSKWGDQARWSLSAERVASAVVEDSALSSELTVALRASVRDAEADWFEVASADHTEARKIDKDSLGRESAVRTTRARGVVKTTGRPGALLTSKA